MKTKEEKELIKKHKSNFKSKAFNIIENIKKNKEEITNTFKKSSSNSNIILKIK